MGSEERLDGSVIKEEAVGKELHEDASEGPQVHLGPVHTRETREAWGERGLKRGVECVEQRRTG